MNTLYSTYHNSLLWKALNPQIRKSMSKFEITSIKTFKRNCFVAKVSCYYMSGNFFTQKLITNFHCPSIAHVTFECLTLLHTRLHTLDAIVSDTKYTHSDKYFPPVYLHLYYFIHRAYCNQEYISFQKIN